MIRVGAELQHSVKYITPSNLGVASYLILVPLTSILGVQSASLGDVEKKLDSLLLAFNRSFHFLAHSDTTCTAS